MQPSVKQSPTSDDEEDLESLRLAALQSLKRPGDLPRNDVGPVQIPPKLGNPKTFGAPKNLHKRGRGFHGGGRITRNGPYNRVRNSNLISVPTVGPNQPQDSLPDVNRAKKFSDDSIPKLILPQDRYCNRKISIEEKVCEASSKFDRYNNSDNSDSESESEDEKLSETESPRKFERSNSLEALMQELENEIQGETKQALENSLKVKSKVKKSRKSKQEITDTEVILLESGELCASESEAKTKIEVEKSDSDEISPEVGCKEIKPDVVERQEPKNFELDNLKNRGEKRRKSKSPIRPPVLPNRRPHARCVPQNLHINQPLLNLPYINTNPPVTTSVMPFQPAPYTTYSVPIGHVMPFEPPLPYPFPTGPPMLNPNSPPRQMFSPNRYERPISPLTIKTDILNTISAPLSPRSAAFVLQNREIIERRKKSPRRSYSRSPSPEFRRSLSPRYRRSNSRPSRSPSPIRQRHSPNHRTSPGRRASPNRLSPNLRRISPGSRPSSRRASPNMARYRLSSPKRPSPGGRNSPKTRPQRSPPRSNIRNRLGTQSVQPSKVAPLENSERERKTRKRSRSISLSLSPSPERFSRKNSPRDDDGPVDFVLEARRRKFEVGAVPTEGIIRLKPKADEDEVLSKDGEEQEEPQQAPVAEETPEDELQGGDDSYIDFTLKVDDLFSDEESDNENEGRFKSDHQQAPRSTTVMPFTQLLNGPAKNVKNETLKDKRSFDRDRVRRDRSRGIRGERDRNLGGKSRGTPERSRHKEDRDREKSRARPIERQRSRSPVRSQLRDDLAVGGESKQYRGDGLNKNSNSLSKTMEVVKKEERRPVKSSLSVKADSKLDRRKPPIVSPIENKKIEIKIRNPSKYEVESCSYDVANRDEEPAKDKKANSRKVEVANDPVANEVEDEDFEEPEPEIQIDNEEDDDEDVINKNEDAGDLRAQLSRKRAERQNKLPKVEAVPSRLLQNALQGAVFKKSKKSKSKKKDKEAAPLDDVDASVCAAVRRTTAITGHGAAADINYSTATSKDRKVRLLYCDAEPLPTASDAKIPIHLRLGIPSSLDIFTESKTHKISRKRSKNRGTFDQV